MPPGCASKEGRICKSECTCPFWTTCKHAVAVVLEHLENIKNKKAIGRVEEDDPRLLQLDAPIEHLRGSESWEEFDLEEYEEDWEEEEGERRDGFKELEVQATPVLFPARAPPEADKGRTRGAGGGARRSARRSAPVA